MKNHLLRIILLCSLSLSLYGQSSTYSYVKFNFVDGESTGGDTQRYKYNGKELDRMHGLDWYDYGARHMDGMRFTTIVKVMYWRRNK